MTDIELVIKIPEVFYEALNQLNTISYGRSNGKTFPLVLFNAIKNGTVLSKGHGAIIDIKELEEFWKEHEIGHSAFNGELLYDAGRTSRHDVIWKPLLDVLPTIIEADDENYF